MASNKVVLIPWDVKSEQHLARMRDQRLACGWRIEEVPEWEDKQVKGTKFMYWIALADDLEGRDKLLETYFAKYPKEKIPLKDTLDEMRFTPRTPTNKEFFPIGHLGLEKQRDTDARLKLPTHGVYWITSLYVSWAIQGGGFGRAAMGQLEKLAADVPFFGTDMVLDTLQKEFQLSPELSKALFEDRGHPTPKILFSNEEWFTRQGYEIFYKEKDGYAWPSPADETKTIMVPLVYLKKTIAE